METSDHSLTTDAQMRYGNCMISLRQTSFDQPANDLSDQGPIYTDSDNEGESWMSNPDQREITCGHGQLRIPKISRKRAWSA